MFNIMYTKGWQNLVKTTKRKKKFRPSIPTELNKQKNCIKICYVGNIRIVGQELTLHTLNRFNITYIIRLHVYLLVQICSAYSQKAHVSRVCICKNKFLFSFNNIKITYFSVTLHDSDSFPIHMEFLSLRKLSALTQLSCNLIELNHLFSRMLFIKGTNCINLLICFLSLLSYHKCHFLFILKITKIIKITNKQINNHKSLTA